MSDRMMNAVVNEHVEEQETNMDYQTLLTCMAVDGGPEDCCGCFNGRQNGESIEFFCNECGRVAFNAVLGTREDGELQHHEILRSAEQHLHLAHIEILNALTAAYEDDRGFQLMRSICEAGARIEYAMKEEHYA